MRWLGKFSKNKIGALQIHPGSGPGYPVSRATEFDGKRYRDLPEDYKNKLTWHSMQGEAAHENEPRLSLCLVVTVAIS